MAIPENISFEVLLAFYPGPIQQRYWEAKQWLQGICPDLKVEGNISSGAIGFLLGPGYKGTVCTLILSQKGLKLGLAYSAGFPDPHGLLMGKGKVHRHVVLPAKGPGSVVGLEALMLHAITACRARMQP